jgi:hypothetical protein
MISFFLLHQISKKEYSHFMYWLVINTLQESCQTTFLKQHCLLKRFISLYLFIIINFQCIPLENNVTSVGLLRLVANLDARRQSRAAPVRAPTSETFHDVFPVTNSVLVGVPWIIMIRKCFLELWLLIANARQTPIDARQLLRRITSIFR